MGNDPNEPKYYRRHRPFVNDAMIAEKLERKLIPDDIVDRGILLAYTHIPAPTMRELAVQVGISHQAVKARVDWLIDHEYMAVAQGMRRTQARALILAPKGYQFLEPHKYGRPGEPFRNPR